MEKIRKPTTNVFRLLLTLIVLITLILTPLCFYSYFYYYGVPQNGPSGTYLRDNVTFVHTPEDYEEPSIVHPDPIIHNFGAGIPGQLYNTINGATTKRGDGENRLLETTIRKQNVAKLRRELIYIYKLPPATDEDYEEELKVDWHHRRGKTAGGVWFFDDLDTDDEDYLEVGGGGSNNNNLPGSSNKRVPHRLSPGVVIVGSSKTGEMSVRPSKKPFTNNRSRFHVNVKAEHEINRSQQPGTLMPINVQNLQHNSSSSTSSSSSTPHFLRTTTSPTTTASTILIPGESPSDLRRKSSEKETDFGGTQPSSSLPLFPPQTNPKLVSPTKSPAAEEKAGVVGGSPEEKKRKYFNTGHFRKSHAIIWDPHPQYIFHAFGHRFHLLLNLIPQRHSFLTPHLTITTHSNHSNSSRRLEDNESFVWRDNLQEEISGCFYNGFVLGDPHSSVAVSLCHGMTGHIRTSHGSYFIEPLPQNSPDLSGNKNNKTLHETNDGGNGVGGDGDDGKADEEEEEQILHEIYQVGIDLPKEGINNNAEGGKKETSSSSSTSSEDYSYEDESFDNLRIGSSSPLYDDEDPEDDYWLHPGMPGRTTPPPPQKKRTKRSMSKERYVELSVVTDSTMSTYHGENLKHYVLTLLSIVALIYKDASIGNPVNIALVSFHVLPDKSFATNKWTVDNSTSSEYLPGISASEMLRNFCKWQKEHNILDDKSPHHHDTALLLTRETICRNPWLHKCDTLGLAELGTMCDHYASCAIVQDNGLSAAFTIAHELGHVMNMPHDDDYKCQSFLDAQSSIPKSSGNNHYHHQFTSDSPVTAKEPQHYVMSRMLDHNTYPWAWSRCSRHFLTEFLDAGHGYCLEDKPGSNLLIGDGDSSDSSNLVENYTSPQQPGEIFSEHKQCELVFGPTSQLCSYMPPCRRLWCTTGTATEEQEGCRTQHMPWADGTPCGSNKWCQRGACVLRDLEKLKTVNGGWGLWMEYGECSRSCGGGVRKSYRECDNPRPSNGGKYCIGPRVRYESCNTHECPNESDYRAEQCAHFNNDNFNIQGLPKDITWVPKYHGISPKDRCKLFCRVQGSSSYYLLREKVVDGTPCGIDTFDVCVNGACLPAGCDRRLHSNKALDICGVCGGDGKTCRTAGGAFNESQYGYNTILRIPAGASNIDIRQRSFDDTARDDNYLALLDSNEEYILNGHFVVSMFRKTVHYGGSILEYSGSDEVVERINSSSRPIKSDLILQVLSVGKLHPPDISYQYVISLSYNAGGSSSGNGVDARWTFTERWTTCNEICQGIQSRIQICSNSRTNTEVSSEYCRNIGQLNEEKRPCNTHCSLKWVKYQKPCDCVHPNRTEVSFKCVRETLSNKTYISDGYCSKLDKPSSIPDCVEECSRPKWRWTQWSECSVRCGEGSQLRNVWCQKYNMQVQRQQHQQTTNENGENDNYILLSDSECVSIKPSIRRKCHNGPCGQWKVDQWSPCSATCGQGISRAAYACYLEDAILPSDYCINQPKPPVERSCEAEVPCVEWAIKTSEDDDFVTDFDEESYWSECTTPCNPTSGYQARPLVCVLRQVNRKQSTSKLKQVSENLCSRVLSSKPASKRVCPKGVPSHCFPSPTRVSNTKRSYYDHIGRNHNSIESSNSIDDPVISLPLVGTNSVEAGYWTTGPWGDCFRSSNTVIRTRDVTCSSGRCRETRPFNTKGCGVWHTGEWEKCNSTCENRIGYETRVVKCVPSLSGDLSKVEPLDASECLKPTPENSRICSTVCKRKGKWRTGPWGKCSRPCGVVQSGDTNVTSNKGQRMRQVACVDEHKSSTILPDIECDVSNKPENSSQCTDTDNLPCPVWSVAEWSECMATTTTVATTVVNPKLQTKRLNKPLKKKASELCGNDITHDTFGHRERIVKCHDHNGHEIPEYHCILLNKKPEHSEVCTLSKKSCAQSSHYRWRVGNWTQCSKNCGSKGVKTRIVECTKAGLIGKINTTLVVDDKFCSRGGKKRKPKMERGCARYHCPYKWVATEWSECSRTCGYGIQHRQVTCHRVNKLGWIDPDPVNGCEVTDKPKEYNYCILSESCRNSTIVYKWTTEPWSPCPTLSQSCEGFGKKDKKSFQKRRVYCTMNGQRTAQRHCEKLTPKPIRKRKCGRVPCGYNSCLEVKRAGNYHDGEYQMLVAGMNVSIYCHGLSSDKPTEYLSLWDDNYSEIYDKRLIRPETCPRSGKRLDSCECIQDRNRRSGLTTWSKVRLNVTNLKIDTEDFQFAKSTGDLIPFGTSGDCYSSSMNCPQGRFSIDLRRTKLAVNSFTTWVSQGHKPAMQISKAAENQKVEGKCGGYCGTCGPNRISGLKLEVIV